MAAQSRATTNWVGSLTDGRGTTKVEGEALPEFEVTWQARVHRTEGTTSPEELLAAAHASCYCMALSNDLSEGGNEPEQLRATATVSFEAGVGVRSSAIEVVGRVPGIDQGAFEAAAKSARDNCPISGALKGNVEITVDATLEG